jgi:hypothetical protein
MAEYQAYSSGGYRVKFRRQQFLEIVRLVQPKIIYYVKNMYFFSFDGFAVYTNECADSDFSGRKVVEAIEFSNMPWSKT